LAFFELALPFLLGPSRRGQAAVQGAWLDRASPASAVLTIFSLTVQAENGLSLCLIA
jgi:hypothetical protein